jgi:hypothetical protein
MRGTSWDRRVGNRRCARGAGVADFKTFPKKGLHYRKPFCISTECRETLHLLLHSPSVEGKTAKTSTEEYEGGRFGD